MTWWPLAWSADLGRKRPLAVRVGKDEIVLFRDSSDQAYALEDRCAHRRVPLSLGMLTGDGHLQCGYHGWTYQGGTGQCVRIPNFRPGERISPRIKVITYPLQERNGVIFVQVGEVVRTAPDLALNFAQGHTVGELDLAINQTAWLGRYLYAPAAILGIDNDRLESICSEVTAQTLRLTIKLVGGACLESETWAVSAYTVLTSFNAAGAVQKQVQIACLPLPEGCCRIRWRYRQAGLVGAARHALSYLPEALRLCPLNIDSSWGVIDSKRQSPLIEQWYSLGGLDGALADVSALAATRHSA